MKFAFLSSTNPIQVSIPLVSFYNIGNFGRFFFTSSRIYHVSTLCGGEIETRWDEKFFNIEWRLGTWGGL